MRILSLLLISAVNGYALAVIARLLGDRGPKQDGRQTLNPFTHLDVLGAASAILSSIGWIRPMSLKSEELKYGFWGLLIAILGSLAIVVVFALALYSTREFVILSFGASWANQIVVFLRTLVEMSIVFAIINLIPILPFTMGYAVQNLSESLYKLNLERMIWVSLLLVVIAVIDHGTYVRAILRPMFP